MMEEFMKDIQRVCSKHNAEIYPGYIDKAEEESGVVVMVEGYIYSLEDVNGRGFTVNKIESENYPKEDV